MIDLNFPIAFGAGVLSFFAPCVIPLIPAYIGYVAGVSVKELREKGDAPFRKKMFTTSLLYIAGFSLVFLLLGVAAGGLGTIFRRHANIVQKAGGLIILLFGLEFAGFLKIPFLAKTKQFALPVWTKKLGPARAFVIGIVFATAWTPCIGAILGSILALAAVSGTALHGAWLLFAYSLGISIPFLLVSLTLASAPKYLKVITRKIDVISKIAGLVLVILGLLLLTNTYRFVNYWLFEQAANIGYKIR